VSNYETNVQVSDAQKLAVFLRSHPEALQLPAHELASKFGLPLAFVESVLSSLETRRERSVANLDPAVGLTRKLLRAARLGFRKLTFDPLVFIGVSTALAIGLFLAINFRYGSEPGLFGVAPNNSITVQLQGSLPAFISIVAITLLLHMACYFRYGMVRIALLGGLITWVISSVTLILLAWIRLAHIEEFQGQILVVMLLFTYVALVLCSMYTALSAVVSVLGGTFWVRQAEKQNENRTRQELIEHLFDLQKRLNEPERQEPAEEESRWRLWLDATRRNVLGVAIGLGGAYALLELSVTMSFVGAVGGAVYERNPLFVMTWISLKFLEAALMAFVAFGARKLWLAALMTVIFELSTMPVKLLPLPTYGWDRFLEEVSVVNLTSVVITSFIIAAIATLGAKVEARATNDRLLKANDKAALLAEIVKTEWQLAIQTTNICVLVVDVARSSQMKQQANPLEVEYSFREYQRFIKESCHAFEGAVHSTAGDGAVVAFANCLNAFEAARRIQTDIAQFNRTRNRLKSPFRVRIGLHVGPVAGELDDVQFTEVIDIAAHVESNSPVGGIALTQPVAEQLPGVRLAQLQERIGGHAMYVALNPTFDA
jgi:class 3 adenylate cyclase